MEADRTAALAYLFSLYCPVKMYQLTVKLNFSSCPLSCTALERNKVWNKVKKKKMNQSIHLRYSLKGWTRWQKAGVLRSPLGSLSYREGMWWRNVKLQDSAVTVHFNTSRASLRGGVTMVTARILHFISFIPPFTSICPNARPISMYADAASSIPSGSETISVIFQSVIKWYRCSRLLCRMRIAQLC